MKPFSLTLVTCTTIALATVQHVRGQGGECPSGDHACLDRQFGAACSNISAGATVETCSAYLEMLGGRPDADIVDVQLLLAAAYRALADTFSDGGATSEYYREQAAATFRQVHDRNPENVQALYGMGTVAPTREARLDYLRQIVETNPSDVSAVESLVRALRHLGTPGVLEAIDVRRRGYDNADRLDAAARWRLAFGIVLDHQVLFARLVSSPSQLADAQARLDAFLDEAREDFRWEQLLSDISESAALDVERTTSNLSTVCHRHALTVFGPTGCMESIAHVAETVTSMGASPAGLQLADATASTMLSTFLVEFLLHDEYPDYQDRFLLSLRRMLSVGAGIGTVYVAYANIESDPQLRLIALQDGSARFPSDGQIALTLGSEYLRQGMRDQAADPLLMARAELPDYTHGRIDRLLGIASGEVSMPAEWMIGESGGAQQ